MSTANGRRGAILAAVWGGAALWLALQTGLARAAEWRPQASTGYDAYLNSYYLADTDTTETVAEVNAAIGVDGRSARDVAHRWSLRAAVSGGSELWRESLGASYRFAPERHDMRVRDVLLRADLDWLARQYRPGSNYSLTSDTQEGRAELRLSPWRSRRLAVDVRGRESWFGYATPSSLEQSYHEQTGGAYVSTRGDADGTLSLGVRASHRVYPDTAQIDRRVLGVELDGTRLGDFGDLTVFHRSERRRIADDTVKPSAWLHWSQVDLALSAGPGQAVCSVGSELWHYDREEGAYFDSWRLETVLGYRWGDILGTTWQAGVTGERLAAGDNPETYDQAGLRGGLDMNGNALSGSLTAEVGRRWYRHAVGTDEADFLIDYSDLTYYELWLMAAWTLSSRLSIEATASYQPERHTEQDDNTTLGYGSLRLVWRR